MARLNSQQARLRWLRVCGARDTPRGGSVWWLLLLLFVAVGAALASAAGVHAAPSGSRNSLHVEAAGDASGRIAGRVFDGTGAAIVGARVGVRLVGAVRFRWSGRSDADGRFVVPRPVSRKTGRTQAVEVRAEIDGRRAQVLVAAGVARRGVGAARGGAARGGRGGLGRRRHGAPRDDVPGRAQPAARGSAARGLLRNGMFAFALLATLVVVVRRLRRGAARASGSPALPPNTTDSRGPR